MITATYPLASLQAGMLVNYLRAPHSGVDVVHLVTELHEAVDVVALHDAWMRVSDRHDALRTAFRWDGVAEPQQDVHDSALPPFVVLDWSDADAGTIDERYRAFLAADRTLAFDLSVAPLQRITLMRLAESVWRMVWTFHHGVMDGRSFPIVLREVFAIYDGAQDGHAPELPTRRPYRDFVEWSSSRDHSGAEPFWRERMRGLPAATPLPAGFSHTGGVAGRGFNERKVAAGPTAALEKLVRANKLTMNNVVQGAWALLLARHSGENDVVFGATRACRKGTIEGADDMVGMFINTLPVRVAVRPEQPLVAWLGDLRETWRSLFDVEHTPLRLVQRWSEMSANSALFESQIVFENLRLDETLQGDGGRMATRGFGLYGATNFPLTGIVFGGREMTLQLENARDTIDDVTASRLLDHLATLLESMAAHPDATVGELSMLPAMERRQIDAWNETSVSYPAGDTLASLLASQAALTPDATAVMDDAQSLTYAELDDRATHLARRLRALGVGRDVLVAVCAERSVELVIALMAVVKAGGAYVPLDPDYPRERLAFMLEDAAAPVLLAQRRVEAALPAHSATVVWLDDVAAASRSADAAVPALEPPSPDDAAYMIYTSGSTGRPKGARNAHRGIVNRLRWMQGEYALGATDVVLQKTPFSFDVSVWEFFWPLLFGAKLVMARPGGHRETGYLVDVITTLGVTVCHFVPSMLRAFLADGLAARCTSLRDVMASGEALPPDLVGAFYRALPGARLHNLYGPTECAVDVSYWPCPPSSVAPAVVPIGRPVANTQLYVLDDLLAPCPIGVPGELYLGGVQVGLGYHNRPELTAERFVPSVGVPSERMYRTGDRARWRPDGTVEYLGRLDFQVKLRGYRIELGEIESALAAHSRIREAVVVARADASGEQRLVAYVVADGEAPVLNELREHLMTTLPSFMVPAAFVWLPSLPLSSNGKVDRRALPAPELDRQTLSRAYIAPRTPQERALAEIWQRVLRVEQVGVDDNLFELGGDSLLSVQIVSQARRAGLRVTLTQVLRNPTVAGLVQVAQVADAVEQQGEVIGAVPLTPVQHWFFEGQRDEASHWNQAFLFTVPADLDVDALRHAVDAVTTHHDSLRLRFAHDADGWRQQCVVEPGVALVEVVDVSKERSDARAASVTDVCLRIQGSLDIAFGPLLRVAFFRLGATESARLLIAAHHLAIDGVSWTVLREDLETAYFQRVRGEAIVLPPSTTPFSRWATRLGDRSVRDQVRSELAYWERVGSPESRRLPRDIAAEGEDLAARTQTVATELTVAETRALLQQVPAAYNTQINDALLAALADSIGAWAGEGELVVNLEGHGREDIVEGADLTRTMGWFTTIFPLRLRLGHTEAGARLKETKEQLRAVPHRGLGYGVLRYLDAAETLRAQTTPDIVFNYLGQFDQVLAGSSLFGFAPESTGSWYGARTLRRHLLEINAWVTDGKLEVRWSFSDGAHRRETISRVADSYTDALRRLIAHCTAPGVGGYTPSDFPLVRLEQSTLDLLAGQDRDIEAVYPLLPLQRLFLGYADPTSDPGFEQWRYQLRGPLDTAALHAAWDLVTARHAIFRTAFVSKGLPEPMQVVRRRASLGWAEHDLRGLPVDEQGRRMAALLSVDRAAGFAFDRAPLMRIMLVRIADDLHELVWSNHHLLLDRWSWPLVLLEIAQSYPALAAGEHPALEPAARYADFVAWQQAQSVDEAQAFWSRHFEGFAPPPRLAPSHVDSDLSEPEEVAVELTAAESHAVHALARAKQVPANTVMAGAWALWLARRAGQSDVSFGIALAGRDGDVPGLERLIGLTLNNLPIRVQALGDSLGAWLSTLHLSQAEIQRFAHTPLERVQEWSGVPWHTRLFDTLLVFQHDDAEESTRAWLGAAIETTLVHVPTRTAYPLSVMIAGGDAIALRVTFDPRYFDSVAAREMAEGFRRALLEMVAAPDASVAALVGALPAPVASVASAAATREYVAPRTATETVLAGLWSDVLGVERVGATDNFFALGGYSLVATQIVSRVRATLQQDAPVRVLFANPTVSAFAIALTARERKPGELERIAKIVQRVHAMSLDEIRHAGSARDATT